jgi:hypothetical protein
VLFEQSPKCVVRTITDSGRQVNSLPGALQNVAQISLSPLPTPAIPPLIKSPSPILPDARYRIAFPKPGDLLGTIHQLLEYGRVILNLVRLGY